MIPLKFVAKSAVDLCATYQRYNQLYDDQLQSATTDELCQVKLLVDRDSGDIASKIDAMHQATIDQPMDLERLSRLKRAKRIRGRLSQRIQLELTRRRRATRAEHKRDGDRLFISSLLQAMDQLLTPEAKSEILALTKSILHAQGEQEEQGRQEER